MARAFWSVKGVPFLHPGLILYAFYPELQRVDAVRPSQGDEFYDVLLLGESVLHGSWGSVEQSLAEQLARSSHRHIRVFNLAMPGHSSRDSWLKYAALGDARFNLIVLYDGINETRANNVPPEWFRDDYSHYSWYEMVNALSPYHRTALFALPYTLRSLMILVRQMALNQRYVGIEHVRDDWIRFGADIRSAESLDHNFRAILDLAAGRHDRVVLMTFATYVPADYSLEAFRARRLDYGLHLTPLEMWGSPDHVRSAVAAHNAVIRRLASEHHEALFVDQASQMPGSGRYFNDPCHLTVDGSVLFAKNLVGALLPGTGSAGAALPASLPAHDESQTATESAQGGRP